MRCCRSISASRRGCGGGSSSGAAGGGDDGCATERGGWRSARRVDVVGGNKESCRSCRGAPSLVYFFLPPLPSASSATASVVKESLLVGPLSTHCFLMRTLKHPSPCAPPPAPPPLRPSPTERNPAIMRQAFPHATVSSGIASGPSASTSSSALWKSWPGSDENFDRAASLGLGCDGGGGEATTL